VWWESAGRTRARRSLSNVAPAPQTWRRGVPPTLPEVAGLSVVGMNELGWCATGRSDGGATPDAARTSLVLRGSARGQAR
jgi:hypothetical protein